MHVESCRSSLTIACTRGEGRCDSPPLRRDLFTRPDRTNPPTRRCAWPRGCSPPPETRASPGPRGQRRPLRGTRSTRALRHTCSLRAFADVRGAPTDPWIDGSPIESGGVQRAPSPLPQPALWSRASMYLRRRPPFSFPPEPWTTFSIFAVRVGIRRETPNPWCKCWECPSALTRGGEAAAEVSGARFSPRPGVWPSHGGQSFEGPPSARLSCRTSCERPRPLSRQVWPCPSTCRGSAREG